MSTNDDSRLLDLARRLLDGEAIDWAQEGIAEAEVREGMKLTYRRRPAERARPTWRRGMPAGASLGARDRSSRPAVPLAGGFSIGNMPQ